MVEFGFVCPPGRCTEYVKWVRTGYWIHNKEVDGHKGVFSNRLPPTVFDYTVCQCKQKTRYGS